MSAYVRSKNVKTIQEELRGVTRSYEDQKNVEGNRELSGPIGTYRDLKKVKTVSDASPDTSLTGS